MFPIEEPKVYCPHCGSPLPDDLLEREDPLTWRDILGGIGITLLMLTALGVAVFLISALIRRLA